MSPLFIKMLSGEILTIRKIKVNGEIIDNVGSMHTQLDIMLKYDRFTSDEGIVGLTRAIDHVFVQEEDQIADDSPALNGICACCGQGFFEKFRRHPEPGYKWLGILKDMESSGICPRCHNDYGIIHGDQVEWDEDDWKIYGDLVHENVEDDRKIEAILVEHGPQLSAVEGKLREKIERIKSDQAEKRRKMAEEEEKKRKADEEQARAEREEQRRKEEEEQKK